MKPRTGIIIGAILLVSLAAAAYYRSGLLSLPGVPDGISAREAGLENLQSMKLTDAAVRGAQVEPVHDTAVAIAMRGILEIGKGDERGGIELLEASVRDDPGNLVLGNTLRMEVMKLQRKWLAANAANGESDLRFPDYLQDQPAQFLRGMVNTTASREMKLQLALALVDHMLLFPALEIKAPASVEAMEILTGILENREANEAFYVPALFARGLNHLYRPFNLVWPEHVAAPANAASKDIGLAVAVGRKIGAGSPELKAELSLALGDAYAKEGNLSLARSWWQIANNMAHDAALRERVFTRLQWNDDDVSANLEELLQHQMEDLEHPLSDLSFIWK